MCGGVGLFPSWEFERGCRLWLGPHIFLYLIVIEILLLRGQLDDEGNAFLQVFGPDMSVVHQHEFAAQRESDASAR